RRAVQPDSQHRHVGVGCLERAVTAAAEVAGAGEVEELPARGGRDEHLARVRVPQRGGGPGAPVRYVVEERSVLVAVTPRDDATVFLEQHDPGGRLAVEPLRNGAR